MNETAQGHAFKNQHGENSRYVLKIDTAAGVLYWNDDDMDWEVGMRNATRMNWDDLERKGNIAQRYTPYEMTIQAVLSLI